MKDKVLNIRNGFFVVRVKTERGKKIYLKDKLGIHQKELEGIYSQYYSNLYCNMLNNQLEIFKISLVPNHIIIILVIDVLALLSLFYLYQIELLTNPKELMVLLCLSIIFLITQILKKEVCFKKQYIEKRTFIKKNVIEYKSIQQISIVLNSNYDVFLQLWLTGNHYIGINEKNIDIGIISLISLLVKRSNKSKIIFFGKEIERSFFT